MCTDLNRVLQHSLVSGPQEAESGTEPARRLTFSEGAKQVQWCPKKRRKTQRWSKFSGPANNLQHFLKAVSMTTLPSLVLLADSDCPEVNELETVEIIYAFEESESEDIAKIGAETMDNYLFGERFLSCKVMPPEKVHKELFKEWNVPFHQSPFLAVKCYNQKCEDICKC